MPKETLFLRAFLKGFFLFMHELAGIRLHLHFCQPKSCKVLSGQLEPSRSLKYKLVLICLISSFHLLCMVYIQSSNSFFPVVVVINQGQDVLIRMQDFARNNYITMFITTYYSITFYINQLYKLLNHYYCQHSTNPIAVMTLYHSFLPLRKRYLYSMQSSAAFIIAFAIFYIYTSPKICSSH